MRRSTGLSQALQRHWFLLLLSVGGLVAVLGPHASHALTDRLPSRLVVSLALFLTAWGLETQSLVQVMRRPFPALWALVVSYGAMPGLAWVASSFLPDPDHRLGLLLIVSVPCTLTSAVLWTRMAGGREATALLAILLTTATSWLATTTLLTLLTQTEVSLEPGSLMVELVVVLLGPVALGQTVRQVPALKRFVIRSRVVLGVISKLLIFAVLFKAAVQVVVELEGPEVDLSFFPLITTALTCQVVHLAGLVMAVSSGRLLGFDDADCIALAFGASQKTLPVALFLFERYYKEDHPLAVIPLVFYHGGQLILDTWIAERWARRPCEPKSFG